MRHASCAIGCGGDPAEHFATTTRATWPRSGAPARSGTFMEIDLSGFVAWVTWLMVHLWYLIGFANRLLVLIRWASSFLARGRGDRVITGELQPASVVDAVSRMPAQSGQEHTRRDEAA